MAWTLLLLAGLCEMAWPLGFKYTNGFRTHHTATLITFAIMTASLIMMSQAVHRGIHVGTAYAVWTGMGAAGTALLGIAIFKEPHDAKRLLCLCLSLIILGAAGLKFLSPPTAPAPSAS